MAFHLPHADVYTASLGQCIGGVKQYVVYGIAQANGGGADRGDCVDIECNAQVVGIAFFFALPVALCRFNRLAQGVLVPRRLRAGCARHYLGV